MIKQHLKYPWPREVKQGEHTNAPTMSMRGSKSGCARRRATLRQQATSRDVDAWWRQSRRQLAADVAAPRTPWAKSFLPY